VVIGFKMIVEEKEEPLWYEGAFLCMGDGFEIIRAEITRSEIMIMANVFFNEKLV